MTYDDYVTGRERNIARWLAVAMHAAFLLLLVFGVAWQKRHSEPAAIVDLWDTLPPVKPEPAPKPAPRVEPKPEPKPEPPKPKPEPPPPPPKPEAKPLPKPDIALKEKLEKERKLKEQLELEKKKAEQKRKEDEAKKAKQLEAKKKEEEKRRLEKEHLAQEAEQKRLAQEKAEIAARLAKDRAAQDALTDKYKVLIRNQIKRHIVEPPNLQGNPEVEVQVVLIPGGEVLDVRVRRGSGVPAYDAAVERAIRKASPLPLPPDPALFQQFRELNLAFRPRE